MTTCVLVVDRSRRGFRRAAVAVAVAAVALLAAGPASPSGAAPHWSACGKLALSGRSYQVAVSGKIACSSARHWVPVLQGKLSKHFSSLLDGPPGWRCVAGFTSPSRKVKDGVLVECAKVKSYSDLSKAKSFFIWLPANLPLSTK
jgi:hypothetical protein